MVNKSDRYVGTPLHHAVGGGFKKVVRILVNRGANVTISGKIPIKNKFNETIGSSLLHYGLNSNDREIIEILIDACLAL